MFSKSLYAALYLMCIPLFACVYYFWLPNSFYHSTVQFEYTTMNRAANEILKGIGNSIVKRYSMQPNGAGCGNWRIDPASIRVTSLDAREGKIGFTVSGVSLTETGGHAEYYFSNRFSVTLNQRMITKPPDGEASVYFWPTPETPARLPMGPSGEFDLPGCLFPTEGQFAGLQASMSLANNMRNFAIAVRGFPAQIPGHFWRLAYFSATTITTLGFGDIVPLTTAARIVVSLESVLGIVLMGLFLNAVASSTNQKPRQN